MNKKLFNKIKRQRIKNIRRQLHPRNVDRYYNWSVTEEDGSPMYDEASLFAMKHRMVISNEYDACKILHKRSDKDIYRLWKMLDKIHSLNDPFDLSHYDNREKAYRVVFGLGPNAITNGLLGMLFANGYGPLELGEKERPVLDMETAKAIRECELDYWYRRESKNPEVAKYGITGIPVVYHCIQHGIDARFNIHDMNSKMRASTYAAKKAVYYGSKGVNLFGDATSYRKFPDIDKAVPEEGLIAIGTNIGSKLTDCHGSAGVIVDASEPDHALDERFVLKA